MNPAELAAWTATNRRAADEYRRNPSVSDGRVYGPCLTYRCNQTTSYFDGYCTNHRPQGDQ